MNTQRIEFDNGCFLDYRPASGGTWEIYDVHVPNECRRQGYGKRMIELLFKRVGSGKRVYAITRASNEVAQQFYESLRFEVVGVLRRFYGGEGADAVMFGRGSEGPV